MRRGFFTVERWHPARRGAPSGWTPILHLDARQSATAAAQALQKRGKPGLYRAVQMQRCLWAEIEDGQLRLHGCHASTPEGVAEITKSSKANVAAAPSKNPARTAFSPKRIASIELRIANPKTLPMIPYIKQFAALRLIWTLLAILALATACATSELKQQEDANRVEDKIAKRLGWQEDLIHGREIIAKLSALNPRELAETDVSADQGKRVAFDGVTAPPGDSNDLITASGFRLRVINPSRKDLRPQCVWWEVMIRGTILEVLPESKTIVIEVDEKDWQIIETG